MSRPRISVPVVLVVVTLLLLAGVALAGAATADASGVAAIQDDGSPTADAAYFDGPPDDDVTVSADTASINFSAFDSTDPDERESNLTYEWSVSDGASGEISGLSELSGDAYQADFYARYDVAEADAGQTFDVVLTVTDSDGNSDTDTVTVTVEEAPQENQQPTADLAWADDPSVEQPTVAADAGTIELTAAGSSDPDGDGLSYEWATDDSPSGTLATDGETATYDLVAADAGETLAFEVTVTDDSGASDTATISVVVESEAPDGAPSAEISYFDGDAQDAVTVDGDAEALNFTAFDSADPDERESNLTYEWSVGDGASGQITGLSELSGQQYPADFYARYDVAEADAGQTFDVVLTVTDSDGNSDTATFSVTVRGDDEEVRTAHVAADLEHDTVSPGATTTVSLVLDEVPESGLYGYTLNLALEDSVAEFTGEAEFDDQLVYTKLDLEDAQGDHTATLLVSDVTAEFEPGAQNVHLGTVEIRALAAGTTDVDVQVESLEDRNEEQVPATVSADALTVAYDSGEEPPEAQISWAGESGVEDVTGETVSVGPSVDRIALSAAGTTDPNFDADELDVEWSASAGAGGELEVLDDRNATYHVSNLDRGESRTFDLVVTNPAGTQATASVAVSFESEDASAEAPTAVLQYFDDPDADAVSVDASTRALDFSALESSDRAYDVSELEFHWSVDGAASGSFAESAYDSQLTAQYVLTEADAGAQFDVTLTVVNPAGARATDSLTVTVGDAEGGDDADNGDDADSGDDGANDNDGGSCCFAPSGGSDDGDAGDDTGQQDDEGSAGAPPAFSFSLDSSTGPVVLRGENAQAGADARVDLGVGLGYLTLDAFEGQAAQDAESFEVTISADDREGPAAVDGEVMQTVAVEDDGMLSASRLELSVDESQLRDGVSSGDLSVYGYSDGEWSETGMDTSAGSMSADVTEYEALAVVGPADPATGETGDDGGLGTIAFVLVLGAVGAAAAAVFYLRL